MLIGELARRTGLTASTLRYYEREGLLSAPARSGNRRVYDAAALGRINIINLARSAGFSIAETRAFVSADSKDGLPSARWRTIAQRKTQEIDALIERATQMKRLLALSFQCGCPTIEDCERLLIQRARASRREAKE